MKAWRLRPLELSSLAFPLLTDSIRHAGPPFLQSNFPDLHPPLHRFPPTCSPPGGPGSAAPRTCTSRTTSSTSRPSCSSPTPASFSGCRSSPPRPSPWPSAPMGALLGGETHRWARGRLKQGLVLSPLQQSRTREALLWRWATGALGAPGRDLRGGRLGLPSRMRVRGSLRSNRLGPACR